MTEHRPFLDNAILNIIFNFILTFHSNHINMVGNKRIAILK